MRTISLWCFADVALASRLEDGLNFDQLSLVVLHVLDELADGVVRAVDLVVFGGEGFEEEGGEGGGGDVQGGEALCTPLGFENNQGRCSLRPNGVCSLKGVSCGEGL